MDESVRVGPGIKWKMQNHTGFGSRTVEGYTVDNLDKKNLQDAEGKSERVFILVRTTLERLNSSCLDNEKERLMVCQSIINTLQKHNIL